MPPELGRETRGPFVVAASDRAVENLDTHGSGSLGVALEAVVFTGVQGSGKTTFFAQRFLHTHVLISLDLLRTRDREARLLELCLETGQRFVVDNTNPTAADRARYVAPARARGFRVVAYWFDVPRNVAIERNLAREGRARIHVGGLVTTHKRLEPPTLAEGFDDVIRIEA